MMTPFRYPAVSALAAVLFSVALVSSIPGAAAATIPLSFSVARLNDPSGDVTVSAMAAGRIPCDYNVTNTVLVDEYSCTTYKCSLGRQYRVTQRINMWIPGTPKTKAPLFYYNLDHLCTPTRVLTGPARHGEAGRHPLTCLAM